MQFSEMGTPLHSEHDASEITSLQKIYLQCLRALQKFPEQDFQFHIFKKQIAFINSRSSLNSSHGEGYVIPDT
jgi:hypothetical protein